MPTPNRKKFFAQLLFITLLSIAVMVCLQLGVIHFCHYWMPAWLIFFIAIAVNQVLWYLFTRDKKVTNENC
jgi:hypothetical protein